MADLPRSFDFSFPALYESYNPIRRGVWFGLFRFRSPLLAESSLFLVLLRCFSSDGSPSLTGMTGFEPRRVSPFGDLRFLRFYTPHRSFSQYNTSFFGTRYQGIHCVPLVAFRSYDTEYPALLACALWYYLRVDYSAVKTHGLTQCQPQDWNSSIAPA